MQMINQLNLNDKMINQIEQPYRLSGNEYQSLPACNQIVLVDGNGITMFSRNRIYKSRPRVL